jgi:hypothetical protein
MRELLDMEASPFTRRTLLRGQRVRLLQARLPRSPGLPKRALTFSRRGRFAFLRARDVPVVDTFQIFGLNMVPALVSFDVRWEAIDPPMDVGQGSAVSPTDPAAFLAASRLPAPWAHFQGRRSGSALRRTRASALISATQSSGPSETACFSERMHLRSEGSSDPSLLQTHSNDLLRLC